jgi:hypothetical protein
MADLTESLDQIVGGFAVVFDDEQTHLGIGFAVDLVSLGHHGAHRAFMQGGGMPAGYPSGQKEE